MIIAINTRVISGDISISNLLVNHFLQIADHHPEHQFFFIGEKEITLPAGAPANVKPYMLPQQSDNSLFWKLWYHYKLPAAIRKLKADVLISMDGISSKRIKIPQYLLVGDLGFTEAPELYPANYSRFAKLNSADFFRKAKKIIALTAHLKTTLIKNYKITDSKIVVWRPGIPAINKPVDFNAAEKIKERYTGGKEYFLFYGTINKKSNLVNLLKAFSLFKKRQKSNMQLIIAAPEIDTENEFIKSIALYKHRDDVMLMVPQNENETAALIGAAYACINTSPLPADIFGLLKALKRTVPVIAGNYFTAIEILGDAALLADGSSIDMLAEKMMLIYKDEKKRNELIQKGLEISSQYAEANAVNELSKIVLSINQQH